MFLIHVAQHFSVGVSYGKDQNQTTFTPITVFGKYGEAVAKYVTKGRQVLVEGRIEVSDKGRFCVAVVRVLFSSSPKETARKSK